MNVQKSSDLAAIGAGFKISEMPNQMSVNGYCSNDEFPRLDKLINDLQWKNRDVTYTHRTTTFLKLKGDEGLQSRAGKHPAYDDGRACCGVVFSVLEFFEI